MNNLYYVSAYSWDQNGWWRFLVTGKDEDEARNKVTVYLDGTAKVERVRFICTTPDHVFTEL